MTAQPVVPAQAHRLRMEAPQQESFQREWTLQGSGRRWVERWVPAPSEHRVSWQVLPPEFQGWTLAAACRSHLSAAMPPKARQDLKKRKRQALPPGQQAYLRGMAPEYRLTADWRADSRVRCRASQAQQPYQSEEQRWQERRCLRTRQTADRVCFRQQRQASPCSKGKHQRWT